MNDFDLYDTEANEAREAEAKVEAKRLDDQRIEDLKWLMADKRGRRVMWELLAITGPNVNPFAVDPYTTARNCGQMLIGQHYTGNLHLHCYERYNQMVTEHTNVKR